MGELYTTGLFVTIAGVTISPSGPSTVSEGDSPVQLCVEIDGTTEKNISVSIDTIPGTALGKLYTAMANNT